MCGKESVLLMTASFKREFLLFSGIIQPIIETLDNRIYENEPLRDDTRKS